MARLVHTEESVRMAFNGAKSITDFSSRLGYKKNNGSIKHARAVALRFGMDCNEIKADSRENAFNLNQKRRVPDDEFFVDNVNRPGVSIRKRLIALGVKYECAECGIGPEWNGKKLVIQVDHIDGNNFNNLRSNLRFLCPNCHTQTDTYANKNPHSYNYCECGNRIAKRSKVCLVCYREDPIKHFGPEHGSQQKLNFPPLEELVSEVRQSGWTGAARKYNMVDNTLRKYVARNGIDPKTVKKITKAERELTQTVDNL